MTAEQPRATGRRETRDGLDWLVLTRTFRAPVEDVWAAVTESDRLARWFGSWDGDPAEGRVILRMLYEGEDVAPEVFEIHECDPPRFLLVSSRVPAEDGGAPLEWRIRLDLGESDGVTTLVFAQSVPVAGMADSMGPGWDYYLDRLVAVQSGTDPATIAFDDYYPALADHYRRAFDRT
ncbi:SRPBCC family protein [Nocardioides sp. SYSU DS0651]|uniref:SRPBCC family protein n=1 Tax=Nocardioides sp. SYSU DS0651 TaxID=3415955 RepID=UPI003F4C3B9C